MTSTILGTRTLQLDDNVAAIEVKLNREQVACLDEFTEPKLDFREEFLGMASLIQAGGTVINGEASRRKCRRSA